MTKMFKNILSMMLVLTLLFLATVPVYATEKSEEVYLSDLRIVYAEDYNEAKSILADCDLEGYNLFNANLNANTGKIGVWLAFKTTTDIEDAITDIAIMQMNGGYNEGNYQEMIKQSYAEYLAMGEIYLTAIEYFNMAYNAGHYLTDLAYRQLNFYTVKTEGIEELPDFEGELLGDIFYDGIEVSDLATMFMEGNSYALNNIRSLLAMGVSYNEDGKTYLEKVADEAEKYEADKNIYENEDYAETASMVAATITVFRDMLKELSAYESELNYENDELTELEVKYLNHKSLAELMRGVNYLNGKTLYDFCLGYTLNSDDYTNLYPLVAALNEGQLALTKVAHYYDVVRYSVSIEENSEIDAEIDAATEKYSADPFNVYEGVDRTIYRDTFALTSEAYRADAFTESGLSAMIFSSGKYTAAVNIGIIGSVITLAGIGPHIYGYMHPQKYLAQYNDILTLSKTEFADKILTSSGPYSMMNANDAMDKIFSELVTDEKVLTQSINEGWYFAEKYDYISENKLFTDNQEIIDGWKQLDEALGQHLEQDELFMDSKQLTDKVLDRSNTITNVAYGMYVVGGLMMLASAIKIGLGVYNYYHPEYSDIPTAMVDLIETKDGDRYIKYDVVYEAEAQKDGSYAAADLNAFQANRWNALYYTKSYEAGKPLLAGEFVVSNNNNVPEKGYAPVHRFGEVVSYNINKYNFNDDTSIYLSVKQSEDDKSAVSGVPDIIGSIFGSNSTAIVAGASAAAGAVGSALLRKKKEY